MLSYIYAKKLCLYVFIGFFTIAGAVPWASPSLEILDELNDVEIYKAVVSSMNEWQKRQDLKKINGRMKREDSTEVCYPELGCFESSGPFGYLDMLPSKPEEINTKFLLYPGHSKRRSGSPPAEVGFSNLKEAFEWAKKGFNDTLPTKVLIHGFGSDCSHIWIYEMRSALLAVEEVNVICVDWENGATLPNYVKATANTRLVGKQLAMLLRGLVENNGLSLRNTHLIGFSLGAHVAGFAGAELGNLSRITGLDPAGPLFESQDPRARLDQNDAGFVDVIHSNGENLILGGLGSYQPMGHVDFYPNGGRMQKGCSNLFVGAVSDIIWSSAVEGRSLCNHRRAYKFFTDSVSPRCHFPAFPCESYEHFLSGKCFPCTDDRDCGNMGYYADRSKGRGQLYLITRDEEPFCANQYNVKIETSQTQTPIISYGKIQITLIGDSSLNETFMMTRKEDEEMKLGDSISRILVPHPVLSEPNRIQILYTAYSGWLSSGLTQWRIDKVTLSDSFGKMLSVCKKNLILQSNIPIVLPLYPGECNLPQEFYEKEAEDRIQQDLQNPGINISSIEKNNFIPTPVVRIGLENVNPNKTNNTTLSKSFKNTFNFFTNWNKEDSEENNLKDNDEAETSRAFNSRPIEQQKITKTDNETFIKEIVEPILRPHSIKNGRSHDLDKEKSEITEPILGPTTSRSFGGFSVDPAIKNNFINKLSNNNKEISYNFYDVEKESEWVPSQMSDAKWKRQDDATKVFNSFNYPDNNNNNNNGNHPFEAIATTVQFLPQRLARMFEQAEKYARETILPLVSTYTPKFISDIISPREKPKYLPLFYEETLTENVETLSKNINKSYRRSDDLLEPPATTTRKPDNSTTTTPYTHIQKIRKRGDKSEASTIQPESGTTPKEVSRKARDDAAHNRANAFDLKVSKENDGVVPEKEVSTTGRKGIYVDLPVFEDPPEKMKYIPISLDDS